MTLPLMPQLSLYQLGMLSETALSEIPIFVLPRSNAKDTAQQCNMLNKRHEEINSLLVMGLIEEVTTEFKAHIADVFKRTGRKYKVFGLSELGFCMFKDGIPQTVN